MPEQVDDYDYMDGEEEIYDEYLDYEDELHPDIEFQSAVHACAEYRT